MFLRHVIFNSILYNPLICLRPRKLSTLSKLTGSHHITMKENFLVKKDLNPFIKEKKLNPLFSSFALEMINFFISYKIIFKGYTNIYNFISCATFLFCLQFYDLRIIKVAILF